MVVGFLQRYACKRQTVRCVAGASIRVAAATNTPSQWQNHRVELQRAMQLDHGGRAPREERLSDGIMA